MVECLREVIGSSKVVLVLSAGATFAWVTVLPQSWIDGLVILPIVAGFAFLVNLIYRGLSKVNEDMRLN